MHKNQIERFISISLTGFLLLYALFFYLNGTLDNSSTLQDFDEWIPYDSIHYVEKSESLSLDDLTAIEIVTGALNWISLSIIYKLLNDLGNLAPLGFIIINCLLFYSILRLSTIKIRKENEFNDIRLTLSPILIFACSPYIFAWIIVPNKELIITAGLLYILNAISTRRPTLLLTLSIAIGLFKVQFFLAFVMYRIFYKFRRRKIFLLLTISLMYPLIHTAVPGLQMSHFLDVNSNEIRSAEIFQAIDNLSNYPLGYILIFLLRLVLNFTGGLNPIRIIESGVSMGALAPMTSFILGCLTVLALLILLKRNELSKLLNSKSDEIFYIYCTLVINLTLPFMQPRYYWWIIPLIIIYILFRNEIKNTSTQPPN